MTQVVVLGGGSAGEAFVGAMSRLDGQFQVTLVERALVGGECTYWACMPSKTLLRAPELLAAARQAPGAAEAVSGALALERVFWWRDQVVEGYADEGHREWLADRDTALVRGDEIVSEVSMGKWWTTDLQKRVVAECLQLHGGYGFMQEYPISQDYADAAVQSIYAGSNEIMKVIIAKRMGLGG